MKTHMMSHCHDSMTDCVFGSLSYGCRDMRGMVKDGSHSTNFDLTKTSLSFPNRQIITFIIS